MAHAITLPKLGLTMEEAVVVEWFREDGEAVEKGQPLCSIETDKIVSDIEADRDGFLQRVAPLNQPLPLGALLGYLHDTPEAAMSVADQSGPSSGDSKEVTPAASSAASTPIQETARSASKERTEPTAPPRSSGRISSSPAARRLAAEHGIDLATLAGSGPRGAILKRDVLRATQPASAAAAAGVQAESKPIPGSSEYSRRPMTAMRRATAQRMMKSLASTAQMTGFGKIDMTESVRIRQAMVDDAEQLGARISITDLVLKAAATALREMPAINSAIDGDDVITWNTVHIGLAVALDDGLIVPVIRDVDRLTLTEIARTRTELVEKARSRRLSREDVEGASFTLSNFGSYGGDFETPILNPPQSALLGIGQITEEPAVRNGEIVIRSMMMISLTFDHRLIDGAVAGRFRARIKTLLEQPALWLATLR